MFRTNVRTAIQLACAATVPLGLIWGSTLLAKRLNQRPPPAEVALFSNYVSAEGAGSLVNLLPAGREIWFGDTNSAVKWFNDVEISGDRLVVAGDSRVVTISRITGEAKDISVPPEWLGISALTMGTDPEPWVYTWKSGRYGKLDAETLAIPTTSLILQGGLRQVTSVGDWIIATGPFVDKLLHIYERSRTQPQTGRPLTVTHTLGLALFPGMIAEFARHLNMTSLAVAPSGDKIALAFKWSDRINIYDAKKLEFERAIAGPTETKLSFRVGVLSEGEKFALGPESTYSYIDVTAIPDAIVALYSGRERRFFGSKQALGTQLHVFTWDGRLVGQWTLAEPIVSMAVEPSTGLMYALRWVPRPSVMEIDISEAIRKAHQTSGIDGTVSQRRRQARRGA